VKTDMATIYARTALLISSLCASDALLVSPQQALMRSATHRSLAPCMAAETTCALITLSAEEPKRVAKVLKQAWMEGGVKRGLVGTVLIEETGEVRIACQGQLERLQAFAEWIETSSALVQNVEIVDEAACPAVPLSNKFPLADAEEYSGGKPGSFQGALAEQLKSASLNLKSKAGRTHSNDEGLF